MTIPSWLRSLKELLQPSRSGGPRRKPLRHRLALEPLEDRVVPALGDSLAGPACARRPVWRLSPRSVVISNRTVMRKCPISPARASVSARGALVVPCYHASTSNLSGSNTIRLMLRLSSKGTIPFFSSSDIQPRESWSKNRS